MKEISCAAATSGEAHIADTFCSPEQNRTARSYIISQGDVRCLGVLVELMMGVCDPTVLNGESGYYLTVLGAALSVRTRLDDNDHVDSMRSHRPLCYLRREFVAHFCVVPF